MSSKLSFKGKFCEKEKNIKRRRKESKSILLTRRNQKNQADVIVIADDETPAMYSLIDFTITPMNTTGPEYDSDGDHSKVSLVLVSLEACVIPSAPRPQSRTWFDLPFG